LEIPAPHDLLTPMWQKKRQVEEEMSPEPTGDDVPVDIRNALAASPSAETAWNGLTAIGRRDFIAWINEAKQAETRQRRIERCCENLQKGKRRPCCYAVVPMDLYKALGESPEAKAQWSPLTADEKRDFPDWVEAAENKRTGHQQEYAGPADTPARAGPQQARKVSPPRTGRTSTRGASSSVSKTLSR